MPFRTALPFGYLGIALILGVIAISAIVLVISGIRGRRVYRGLAGLIILGAVCALTVMDVQADERTDLNPRIASDSDLVGIWTAKGAVLDLRAKGVYACRGDGCSAVGTAGRWQRVDDFKLNFVSTPPSRVPGTTVRLRVISTHGRLQLIRASRDPDLWDGRVLFEMVPRAG